VQILPEICISLLVISKRYAKFLHSACAEFLQQLQVIQWFLLTIIRRGEGGNSPITTLIKKFRKYKGAGSAIQWQRHPPQKYASGTIQP
jgi:hypothetical protein